MNMQKFPRRMAASHNRFRVFLGDEKHPMPYRLARLALGASALALLQVLAFFLGVMAEQSRATRMELRAETWLQARRICPIRAQEFLHACLAEVPATEPGK